LSAIRDRLLKIRERIDAAAIGAGRRPEDVQLIAISKTFPAEAIAEAIAAGQNAFGENRVQEAETKIPQLADHPGIEWHLVGHLQSNKVRRAAEIFDCVQSVDSVKLARRLSEIADQLEKRIPVLLQVDLAGEETKYGADPNELPAILEALGGQDWLKPDGLMTIPPYLEDPDEVRPYFARLREIRDSLQSGQPGCLGRGHLSMGMSHDFEAAIGEGATIVRIGTALFGERSHG
jgi:pyridoxal phosphate enzyme (YggS family)